MTKTSRTDLRDVNCDSERSADQPVPFADNRLVSNSGRHAARAKPWRMSVVATGRVGTFLHCFQSASAWWAVLVLLLGLALPASAEEPQPQPQSSTALKNAVILIGANSANDALSTSVQSGPLALDLYFQVEKALKDAPQGKMTVTNFLAQTPPAAVVETKIGIAGAKDSAGDGAPLEVQLSASDLLHVKLTGRAPLRPATTYKGTLFLAAGGQTNRWEVTLTTGARGILAVEPIGTQKLSTFPPCAWIPCLGSYIENCGASIGIFSVTLHDKSEGGPYRCVRVRFEPSGNPASKAITSNFSLDTFSFWETRDGCLQRVDLEQREAAVGAKSQKTVDIDNQRQRTLSVQIKPLSPGEYTGALRFVADESSDDDPDAKLPLTIQVRHHWTLPVTVILFGSLVGWFSSKYVVGLRKARELARQVKELRARADYLVRPIPSRSGWEFSNEATSYGLARVRVMLSQLAKLTYSVLPILVHEQDIQQQRGDADLRLSALESLRDTRLRVQPLADGRPAVQLALGQLLRRTSNLLERPVFTQTQQADLTSLLQTAEAWLVAATHDAKYREALAERRRSQEIPDLGLVQSCPEGDPVRQQLEVLLNVCPTAQMINDEGTKPAKLKEYDETIGKLALLWRERDTAWAKELAQAYAAGRPLDVLFRLVDDKLWETLAAAETAHQQKIERDPTSQEDLEAYDLVEVHLTSTVPGVTSERILYHPLRIGWRIVPPDGNVRRTETDGLTLVQYFPLPGKVKVEAVLRWQGREIPLKEYLNFDVVPNLEYRKRCILSGGFTEWAVMAIAAGFAVATAMGTLYDSTFGSFSQYLTLFLWAAGAGTGGNIFKQLGTTSTPGGQPDAPLPGAGATASK